MVKENIGDGEDCGLVGKSTGRQLWQKGQTRKRGERI